MNENKTITLMSMGIANDHDSNFEKTNPCPCGCDVQMQDVKLPGHEFKPDGVLGQKS